MGNTSTKANNVIIPYPEYLEKLKYHESLESIVKTQRQVNEQLRKQNEGLQLNIEKIQSQSDMKEEENKLLLAEVVKYKSSPICQTALNVNEQIMELEQDIEIQLTAGDNPNRELREDVNKLRKNIDEQKQNMKDYLVELPDMKTDELERLERVLRNSLNSSRNGKKEKLEEILNKLNEIKEKIPNSIQKTWAAVEKDLATNRALFNEIKNDHVDVTYREIKNILIEQENILLRWRLKMSSATVSEKGDDQKSFKNNDEDIRQYSLIFCNIIEEHVDQMSDYAKVRKILNYFTNISTADMSLMRLGRMMPDRQRKIKVTFPNTDSVRIILRYKHKLKDSPFPEVRIFSDKPYTNSTSVTNKTDY